MSTLTGKNIFVTGATGLVGSHLVEELLKLQPRQIVCLSRSCDPNSYFETNNFGSKVVRVNGDLKNKDRMFEILTKYEISHVFHIGAQPIVTAAFINPYETFASNIMGTVNVLEAARHSPYIKAVVVASSDKAYGKNCQNADENFALSGDHPYDVSKSCTDLVARTYYRTYKLPVAISRCGNIFGPGDLNMDRIVPGIMMAAITGNVLDLRSDGTFKRDYIYVKDVVDGYLSLAENIDKTQGEAFNFSSGLNVSVLDLIEKISKVIDVKINYKILNNQKNEIPGQSLNFAKADRILGWSPHSDFESAVKETYAWYQHFIKK
ncbi:MAG: NAD-dependent epimerase/dehydratase family protein [Patescibacteria group bacterium]